MIFPPPPKTTDSGGILGRLLARSRSRGERTALVGNKACRHTTLSYAGLFTEVERHAAGFIELGVEKGDRVALVAENCDLWLIVDLALLAAGATDVPRGGDASADEVAFCAGHAECRAAVVESKPQLEKLAPLRGKLAWTVVMKGDAPEGSLALDAVAALGDERLRREPDVVRRRIEQTSDADLATVIYTSGTTGNPKGVMLTHGNILHNVTMVPEVLHLSEGQRFLSFLPSWHSFERTIDYVVLDSGMELHYSSKWTVREDFKRVRPHFVCGVPRLWETFYAGVMAGIAKLTGLKGALVRGSLEGSRVRADALRAARGRIVDERGTVVRRRGLRRLGSELQALLLLPAHALARVLVYRRLHEALGNTVTAMISGGGPLPRHVDEFFVRAGLPLLNGYGLTESSPVISVRRLERNVLGTIGPPIPRTEIRIVDDAGHEVGRGRRGVIQARGPQIMQGYHANPGATAAALRDGGWLDTGDIGMLSDEGDLVITGRAKDTIVLMGGENVEPEPIEAAITASPLIAEAMLVGHGQKTLGVLLVPDAAALRAKLDLPKETSEAAIARDPRTLDLLKDEVSARISKSRGYRNFELVGRFRVLEVPFSVDDGTLTATMKKRRSIIESRYATLIAAMFDD